MPQSDFGKGIINDISNSREIKIKFPKAVAERFTLFSKNSANDCYWLAVEMLINFYEQQTQNDIKGQLFLNALNDLDVRIKALEDKVPKIEEIKEEEKPKERKTFGCRRTPVSNVAAISETCTASEDDKSNEAKK